MSLIEMTLEYKDAKKPPKAEEVLKAANSGLRLLRALEKERQGKASINWVVGIQCFQSRAVITYDAYVERPPMVQQIAADAAGRAFDIPGVK